MKPIIGLDLDGVIRHNNKSWGSGDIPKEQRNKESLLKLYHGQRLPYLYYVTKPEDVRYIDGALEALAMFYDMGKAAKYLPPGMNRIGIETAWDCYILTNQEAVALGIINNPQLMELFRYMDHDIIGAGGMIQDWLWCPHMPEDNCKCRKPKPGMFYDLRDDYGVKLEDMYYIGDNPSDMQAGKAAGCKTIFIRNPKADPEFQSTPDADETYESLYDAACVLVARHKFD